MSISRPSSSRMLHAARLVASALAVAMLVSPSAASAGAADQVGATFGLMIQDVVAAFPAVEGLVVAVEGDRVYLDLTEKDGVQPGQEFTIFRKGEVFRHPINGRALGRYEQVLGHAQVQRVLPQFSEAVYVAADGQVDSPRPRTACASPRAGSAWPWPRPPISPAPMPTCAGCRS